MLAVGCALENVLLAVQAAGFAAAVRSGKFLETKAMREGFALARTSTSPASSPSARRRIGRPAKPKPELDRVFTCGTANQSVFQFPADQLDDAGEICTAFTPCRMQAIELRCESAHRRGRAGCGGCILAELQSLSIRAVANPGL